jgi:serine phosphatase RsbU (regulator of sigma subunit)
MTMAGVDLFRDREEAELCVAGVPHLWRTAPGRVPDLLVREPSAPLGSDLFDAFSATVPIAAGERLILFTDGIPEMKTSSGRDLGIKRFHRWVGEVSPMEPSAAHGELVNRLASQRGDAPATDDVTLVMIDRRAIGESAI